MEPPNSPEEKMKNGVLSLTHIARLKCINNAHIINDIGTTPYHLIEPVLMKKTAKSLRQIESVSPQIIADSEPLWKSLVKRDFPDRPINQTVLRNGKKVNISSRNLYDKYFKEREAQRQNATNNIKQIVRNLNEIKNKNKVKAINRVLPSNKPKMSYNRPTTNQHAFKSSLLQKARVANKQRVRNFSQAKNNSRILNNKVELVKIGTAQKNLIKNGLYANNKPSAMMSGGNKRRIDLSTGNAGNSPDVKRQKGSDPNREKSKKSNSYIYANNVN